MRFWDTSAIVPLLVAEVATTHLQALYRADPVVVVSWTTVAECASALARAERDGALTGDAVTDAFARLDELSLTFREVEPSSQQRDVARRLLRVHTLRSVDAFQIAAAFLAAEGRPATLELVTLDERLATAARREGFPVTSAVRPESSGTD